MEVKLTRENQAQVRAYLHYRRENMLFASQTGDERLRTPVLIVAGAIKDDIDKLKSGGSIQVNEELWKKANPTP